MKLYGTTKKIPSKTERSQFNIISNLYEVLLIFKTIVSSFLKPNICKDISFQYLNLSEKTKPHN